ncbi:MAG: signal peptidase I [Candidatus Magasanikbacteria bacterium CG_4_9_14_0_2_um_filter_41_10]|uniref:Signal peptidase I n=1 Tax=Candidatus Magasanikbacteria bacterium CG_4_10_14_0_2_um_filter_41_31 TaxID=1974639 RepID=A0A2M7V3J9_9BACT|nr:MAG: signal peptidase I [Candidatus Magasanikbacteria bacterium CG_4_10_14_0_2_um_filter_41_31]PJC53799.1 MAG: signal peptidase I [Candidatus Magasanikbacteria bacterium CG_4_9_14_0_2_um_filter_41_10]
MEDTPSPTLPEEQEGIEDIHTETTLLGKIGLFFLELVKIVVLAAITIVVVRYFLFKPFYVKGESMSPTFYENEYLIVDELSYRLRDPKRGEVIVFRSPTSPEDFYLKRVIGLPGERVRVENGNVTICQVACTVLDEPYLNGIKTDGDVAFTLGDDQYAVFGDNRGASYDTRRFGPISKDSIQGRTLLRGWPLTRVSYFGNSHLPKYNL